MLAQTPLFCMQGPTQPLINRIVQKIWVTIRPTDPAARLGMAIGTAYVTGTYLTLGFLYYCEKNRPIAYGQFRCWVKKNKNADS